MFTVKIITKCGENMITEKAGARGGKVLISFEGPKGVRNNPRPRKLEGWKTRKGALNYINSAIAEDMKIGKDSWYQIESM